MDKEAGATAVDWGVGRYERSAKMLLPAAQALTEAAAIRPGERVLDLGCGSGNVALLAAAFGAQVTAVDPSPRLVNVTYAAAQREGLDITCEVGEAAAVPSPDDSFDCLLSNFGIIFAPDPDAAVTEIARVLRPDGRALVTAWLPGGAIGTMAATAQELVRAAVGAPPTLPGFPWHEQSELQALFSSHGMTAAVTARHELAFTADSPQAYLEAELASHPLAINALKILQQHGQADEARSRLLKVLNEHNEDPQAFRSTSRYVMILALPR